MSFQRRALFLAVCLAVFAPAGAFAASLDSTEPLPVRAYDPALATARTYFIGAGATDEDAIEFRTALVEAGARNVNLFLPDRVIVCDLPTGNDFELHVPGGFERVGATEVESGVAFVHSTWSWIRDAYLSSDERDGSLSMGSGLADGFKDVVVTIAPGRAEEIQQNAKKSQVLRGAAPNVRMAEVSAGSSILTGSVTANFVFPESNGTLESQQETWSDEDLAAAKQGAIEAMLHWQGAFPAMDLNFVFRTYDRIDTGYEPILHSMGNDRLWVTDVLRTMGYGQTNDMMAEVHAFNQDKRALHGTQWVFTAFIACSRNTPNNKFGNGAADYTAYAFLGGPCMIEPFPAGIDINGVGERLVYSQIVNHEVGHCFWTLDEYPGAPGGCGSSSGYLNYGNGNISVTAPNGDELRCNPLSECIMHTAARKNIGRPWCLWSEGHLGVIDRNANAFPDAFEARPIIEFTTPGPDTITTNEYTLRFRVTAQAVPNRNPNIAPDKRVNYALPLRKGWISTNPENRINILPLDGKWDERVEDCEFKVQLATAGSSAFSVMAENNAGFQSLQASKVVHFVGVDYVRTAVIAKTKRNDVAWEIAGDPFGAKFNVYRSEGGGNFQIINRDYVPPSGPPRSGFIPYLYTDHDVVPGHDYRYYVKGHVWLPYENELREYQSESAIIGRTAMIPLGADVISNIAPNPSRGPVTFSLLLPRIYSGPETAPVRESTPIEVAIYSVRGELVRKLKNGTSFDDVMTLHWDGTDQSQRPAPSGVYFVRALAGPNKSFRKIVLLR